MPDVVQAKCPYCKNLLRIPALWIEQPMRCKHCRQAFQARKRATAAPVAVAVRAAPIASSNPFAFDVHSATGVSDPPLMTNGPSRGWWTGIVLGALVLVAAVGIAIAFGPHLSGLFQATTTNGQVAHATDKKEPGDEPKEPKPIVPKRKATNDDPFPRRALLIGVNDYLFANPLGYGERRGKNSPGGTTRDLRTHLETFFSIPSSQCVELSDRATVDPRAPLKSVIEKTIEHFLATSLPQDHIVLFFAGHVVEDEEKKDAYLVPIEGPLASPEAQVPLSWVYAKLQECPARQKVLILDVCRFDPARGNERPGGGPMGKTLDALLQQPPAGVQVWSSCVLEQQAYEFEDGSLFLLALNDALIKLRRIQEHPHPLPIEELVPEVQKYLDGKLARAKELKQTPRLVGKGPAGDAVFDPDRKPPQLAIQPPVFPGGAVAAKDQVEKILGEINQIPPVRMTRGGGPKDDGIKVSNLPPFLAKDLDAYRPTESILDYESLADKFPLRAAVARALRVLQNDAKKFSMKETFSGTSTAAVKKQVLKEQGDPGKAGLYLEEALDELKTVADKRDEEPSPRWKALYDFIVARLMSRIVYVTEYNYLLAQIRTDSLPELPQGASGYRVGSKTKVSTPEGKIKDMVRDIKKAWDKIENEHKGTPWAVIAQRERLNALGLEWRATRQ